jgi:hypothetical protein
VNGHTELVTYRGVRAVKLVPAVETAGKGEEALPDGPAFKDGTIRLDVAGAPGPGMPPDSRGFIGISFRTEEHGASSAVFYLRCLASEFGALPAFALVGSTAFPSSVPSDLAISRTEVRMRARCSGSRDHGLGRGAAPPCSFRSAATVPSG